MKKRIGRSIQTASLLLVLLGLPIGAQSQEASASTLEETLAAEPIPRSKEAVAKLACLRKSIFLDPATRAIWPGRRDETNLNKLDEELRGSRVQKGGFNGQWSLAIASEVYEVPPIHRDKTPQSPSEDHKTKVYEPLTDTPEETLAAEPIPRSKEAVAKLACLRKSIFLDPATRAIWPGRRDETNLNKLDEELRGSRVQKGGFNGQWSLAIASEVYEVPPIHRDKTPQSPSEDHKTKVYEPLTDTPEETLAAESIPRSKVYEVPLIHRDKTSQSPSGDRRIKVYESLADAPDKTFAFKSKLLRKIYEIPIVRGDRPSQFLLRDNKNEVYAVQPDGAFAVDTVRSKEELWISHSDKSPKQGVIGSKGVVIEKALAKKEDHRVNKKGFFAWPLLSRDTTVSKQRSDPAEPESLDHKSHFSIPKRVFLSHLEATENGFGHVDNATTLGILFATDYRSKRFVPMIDFRGHNVNTNTYAANIGLVGRYVSTRRCRILGVNAYYDYRGGCLKNWHQIGAGIEALGRRVEFRANGYYPLGDREHKRTRRFDFEGGFFEVCRKFEIAYMGFNTELGYFMAKSRKGSIYAAVGPYYLSGGCHRESWGGKGRLRFQFKDWMSLEFDASHDSIFETVFQGQIVFSFPFYAFSSKDKKWPCGILNRQVYQPVERIDIIPLTRRRCFKSNF